MLGLVNIRETAEVNLNLNDDELKKLAKKQNKTIGELANDYMYALKDLEYTRKKINSIIDSFNYKRFPDDISVYGYGVNGELNNKFICYDGIKELTVFPKSDLALVTGFGPTNPPTAGTLSSIFKILEMQKATGIYTHIVISELSALNSRQKPLNKLFNYTNQFINFIRKLGFNEKNGEIRTHNFLDHSRTFSIISSVFKVADFIDGEATDNMYKRLNLLGNDYSTMVSQVYTVADIMLPLIRDRKKGVIVSAGLEEHLYPHLAKLSIDRLKKKNGGLNKLIDKNAKIGALYGKLIAGLFPYVKMSKSIKESSINLGDTDKELFKKIVECDKRNEEVILQMMMLASNWDCNDINKSENAFKNRKFDYPSWLSYKKKYYEFFLNIKKLWVNSKDNKVVNIYNELFKR